MILDKGKYYLYRHIRLDKNEPFYIGIGTKPINYKSHKVEYARSYATTSRSSFWFNIVNKIDYRVEILLESDDYQFILKKEIEFIKLYGRFDLGKGPLVNLTDGGEGTKGISEEKRKNLSRFLKERDRTYSFKTVLIFNLKLELICKCPNSKAASFYIFGKKDFYKKISTNCRLGFKTNKLYYVIKEEDYILGNINFKTKRKKVKGSKGNSKSFIYNGKFYKTKTELYLELNIKRKPFEKLFNDLLKNKTIIWKIKK